ncbi:MAG: hypothetical protein U1E02_24500, partial [Hydrogenophaga sp.]|nr:hypothetical protein [Hydrogenophaga sp.]
MFLAPGEDMGSLCIGSDVFYGDSQVPASQVRSTPQKSATEAEGYVRVQSLQAVNEPIVTVYVRASCTAPFTRRFVLLADPITEPSALAVPSPIPATENRRVDDARAAPERPPPVNPPSVASAPEQPVAKPEQPVVRPPKPASVVRRPAAPAPKPTSRLQLEPLDLGPAMELDPVLKMSISLLSGPTSSDETRAAAAL